MGWLQLLAAASVHCMQQVSNKEGGDSRDECRANCPAEHWTEVRWVCTISLGGLMAIVPSTASRVCMYLSGTRYTTRKEAQLDQDESCRCRQATVEERSCGGQDEDCHSPVDKVSTRIQVRLRVGKHRQHCGRRRWSVQVEHINALMNSGPILPKDCTARSCRSRTVERDM